MDSYMILQLKEAEP